MKTKFFSLILMTLFCVSCNNSSQSDNIATENKTEKDSCCSKNNEKMKPQDNSQSEITCPKCGHKKTETLPTDVCVIKYKCENCSEELTPKEGDCCVFCTYGTHKCPSKQ